MPTTEADALVRDGTDQYECAFHVLPTVADGEVADVVEGLKSIIRSHGGEIADEESPQRFTLAYEIRKAVEGRMPRFTSSWFGWMRFSLSRDQLAQVTKEIQYRPQVLRYLIIRITRDEAAHPFRFFVSQKESATVLLSEASSEEAAEVSEEDLNKSLESITS